MKIENMVPESAALLLEDGSAVAIDDLVYLLIFDLKRHGHFGNVVHHVSKGDWNEVSQALRSILVEHLRIDELPSLTINLVRMLDDAASPNLRGLRPWFFQKLETESSTLFAMLVRRRVDTANAALLRRPVHFRASALRILSSR